MFFCLDAKEPKNQVGKSSAKKRYFFLKIPELEQLFDFSFICRIFSLFKQRNFLNEKNIVFLYACGFIGQGFDFGWLRLRSAIVFVLSVISFVNKFTFKLALHKKTDFLNVWIRLIDALKDFLTIRCF